MPAGVPPLTGVCEMCTSRVKVRQDGTLWRHRRKPSKPAACAGSGQLPRLGTVKRKWPTRISGSVRTVSGGAFESDRRKH